MNLDDIKKEYEEILNQLSNPELISDWPPSAKAAAGKEKFEELLRRKKFLEQIIEKEKELQEIKNKIEENKSILKSKEDEELYSLAETEITQLKEKGGKLEKELKDLLSGGIKEKETPKAIIMEIRAGTGGEEAALFAADLFRMYSKHAALQGWNQKVLDSRPSELEGFKEITFEINPAGSEGDDIFSKMQYEAGVHRVQRIPATEKSGRIHTSTASVAVLQKPRKGKIVINNNDLKIDTYKASGPGGQYVNKRMTAVRITHLPTGLVVTSQTARNLQQNKENALGILAARLLEKKETEEGAKIAGKRRAQIGGAKRAEKVRTYNFPQDRVTDHRIKKSFHNIEGIMEGKLNPIIEALKKSGV